MKARKKLNNTCTISVDVALIMTKSQEWLCVLKHKLTVRQAKKEI